MDASQPLPPYSYVPGKFPHPFREPQGHSYGEPPARVEPAELGTWWRCTAYVRGIELFNAGYYWEAHESWEAVWNACGRRGVEADFLKALIKLAAALVKGREGRAAGVVRHARRAGELLTGVQQQLDGSSSLMGLSLADLLATTRVVSDNPEQFVNTSSEAVVRFANVELRVESPAEPI